MRYKLFKMVFLVWIILWAWFLIRDLLLKDNLNDYRNLFARSSLEGKHSYVTGDRLYEFIIFCASNMPPGSSYKFAGLEEESIENRRAVYYLYPMIEKKDAEYILIYDRPGTAAKGYSMLKKLDDSRYILKKEKEQ